MAQILLWASFLSSLLPNLSIIGLGGDYRRDSKFAFAWCFSLETSEHPDPAGQPDQEDSIRDDRGTGTVKAGNIAPWPVLNSSFPQTETTSKGSPGILGMHKRTMTPSEYLPESSPSPPIRPLSPERLCNIIANVSTRPPPKHGASTSESFEVIIVAGRELAPSTTFGSRTS
ncbi:hypothetical protein EV360DRAFT_87533 [Lentinula raphanica]|nr:hypothetical protein EV360DRAFT_87533 [Lentinula raphanica]